MSPVPRNLEKVVVSWAKKNKRHVSADISPTGYWEAQGSELQKNQKINNETTTKKGPKPASTKQGTVTSINKNRV